MLIKRTNQGGSVASFIVIGLIMISGLVGTVYFVNQRGEQVRTEKVIAAVNSESKTKKQGKAKDSPKPEVTESSVDTTTNDATNLPINTDDLPVTGTEMSFAELFIVYALTTFLTAYLISKRKLARSL